ncbi:MAG: hypothetical protein L0271_10660 [Gemmatimonadetes bacterium]|nr:hypothetical protein [Gemmatimonadota bacterium]
MLRDLPSAVLQPEELHRHSSLSRRAMVAGAALTILAAVVPPVSAQRSAAETRRIAEAAMAPVNGESLVQAFEWRNIGPANMAGRVTDIEAVESNPAIVYVGSASGGVFKSVNAGTTWEAIFTGYGSGNIGDLAVFQPDPDIVWVGTGESCVRNSVGWGDGVYRSTDGGRTFTNVGLAGTHHISEVLTHPTDADVAYVAAQGHLWGHTGERGVYRTRDGGRTWQHLTNGLPNDGRTGASDLVMDPANPNVLYAGFWERIRMPHRFLSGGPAGGIFKSTDGGDTWTKLTNGLPTGETGKIGLSVFRRDPRILVAIVEHGYQPQQNTPESADMSRLGTGIYRSEDGGQSWRYLSRYNNRPFYYSHIRIDPDNAQRVFVLAGSAQVSEDGGRTFARSLEGIAGDFHALWVDPANSLRFYVGNDKGAYLTHDGGHRFVMFDNMDIGQFYAVTADLRDPYWVYGGLQDNGNWGGPSNSRDYNGVLNDHWFKFHSGDGFHTTVDPNDWRTVYTESQGGNIRRLDAVFRQQGGSITPTPQNILNLSDVLPAFSGPQNRLPSPAFRFNWSSPLTLSPHDSRVVYFGGNYLFRSTDRGDTWRIISPDLSNADTAHINPESGGLTRDVTSAETHATAITISESPLVPGLLWVGTDDGNVQLTRDGGLSWTNVRANVPTAAAAAARTRTAAAGGVPPGTWVSRVAASHYDPATAYVAFDGHRRDDFRPHVYRTSDYGRTWTSIAGDLPADEPVYVITEDARNPRLLFAGTEFGVYVTIDGGTRWHRLNRNLPTVAVHDLIVHPRDNDLIAATHGRSIWILDDISTLQQLTPEVLAADLYLFRNRVATKWLGVSRGATRGHMLFQGRNPLTIEHSEPENSPSELENSATVSFWLKSAPAGPGTIEITPLAGDQKRTAQVDAKQGLNRWFWDLRFDPAGGRGVAQGGRGGRGGGRGRGGEEGGQGGSRGPVAAAGTYKVALTIEGRTHTGIVTVREDPGR